LLLTDRRRRRRRRRQVVFTALQSLSLLLGMQLNREC